MRSSVRGLLGAPDGALFAHGLAFEGELVSVADEAVEQMDGRLEKLYSQTGRPSIAPDRLIRALLLQVLYSIRSERMLVEQLEYNRLFRWFVGLSVLGSLDVQQEPGSAVRSGYCMGAVRCDRGIGSDCRIAQRRTLQRRRHDDRCVGLAHVRRHARLGLRRHPDLRIFGSGQ